MLISWNGSSRSAYNRLPDVEVADRLARAEGSIHRMAEVIGPTFIKHGLDDTWGVSLLHHHWDLLENEIPGESAIGPEGSDTEFLMRPVKSDKEGFYASLFCAENDASPSLRALEFSSDNLARKAYNALLASDGFIEELSAQLISSGLASRFGLALLRAPSSSNRQLVEFTEDDRVSRTCEKELGELDPQSLVQTSWAFSAVEGGTCARSCFKTCSVPSGGGHYPNHNALHNPNG